jgi:hypothetical protein
MKLVKSLAVAFLVTASAIAQAEVTAYDKEIIRDYTAMGYFINGQTQDIIDQGIPNLEGPIFAGTGSPDDIAKVNFQYRTHLNRALDKLPNYGAAGKSEAYRGIYSSDLHPEELYPQGKIWIERRFTSTSVDKKIALSFARGAFKNEGCGGCDPHIKNPDAKLGTFLTFISRTGKEITAIAADAKEREVLFKSGVILKVKSAGRNKIGMYEATIEELDPQQLSAADKFALQAYETQRTNSLIRKLQDYNPGKSLETIISDWNEAHRTWKAEGLLNTEVDFEWLNQGG